MTIDLCRVSIVIPCYNEETSLRDCVTALLDAFASDGSNIPEIIIVDDCSTDDSRRIAARLAEQHSEISFAQHDVNQGKGAALRTGFRLATGDYVAIQDADLEYDPHDLLRLLAPLKSGQADVVYGSRFLSGGAHRVLYFWHSMGNRFLTFLSNMFTDLNLTDMETCYKVFRREAIRGIQIEENRFGFEPEITAKVAARQLRIFEVGISYYGRTYEEGKKIGARDGFRALYCILRYNAYRAPAGLQFALYTIIGGVAAALNLLLFVLLLQCSVSVSLSAGIAFFGAALLNYQLCVWLLFRSQVRWSGSAELMAYGIVVALCGVADVVTTGSLVLMGMAPVAGKLIATGAGLILNFLGRRMFVFPEKKAPELPSVISGDVKETVPDRPADRKLRQGSMKEMEVPVSV